MKKSKKDKIITEEKVRNGVLVAVFVGGAVMSGSATLDTMDHYDRAMVESCEYVSKKPNGICSPYSLKQTFRARQKLQMQVGGLGLMAASGLAFAVAAFQRRR